MSSDDRMTSAQREVATRVVADEGTRRQHLVVHLSGAHAYGFPSPDSDLDLKAVHVLPTRELLGFAEPETVFNRLEIVDGVEVDYTSNEVRRCVLNLLSGDGNMLERVLSARPLATDDALADLRALAPGYVSRRYHRHYRGFARGQAERVVQSEAPTAKKLLYVLRTALTGTHLLLEGECEPDLLALYERYGFPEVVELAAIKQTAERGTLPEPWVARAPKLVERAMTRLDEARASSPLPEEPTGESELEAWLLELRRARW